jgi:hypothetical protein
MFRLPEAMKIYWNKRGEAKATATDITHIEAAIGSKLAKPYIEFVTQFGFVSFDDVVGVEMRCMFDYTIDFPDRAEIREGDIGSFLLPDELIETYGYFTTAEFEGDESTPLFPANYLPVGNDAGQGKILLELGENAGRVWYWPEREWAWGTEGNTWLGFVAENFYDCINNLHPYRG